MDERLVPKTEGRRNPSVQRWGRQKGYCVVSGQKVPLQRPRVRDQRQHEVPLGSYQSLQRASLLDEAVWQKIMRGLSMRGFARASSRREPPDFS